MTNESCYVPVFGEYCEANVIDNVGTSCIKVRFVEGPNKGKLMTFPIKMVRYSRPE
jgi:hypothetical protein